MVLLEGFSQLLVGKRMKLTSDTNFTPNNMITPTITAVRRSPTNYEADFLPFLSKTRNGPDPASNCEHEELAKIRSIKNYNILLKFCIFSGEPLALRLERMTCTSNMMIYRDYGSLRDCPC